MAHFETKQILFFWLTTDQNKKQIFDILSDPLVRFLNF